MTYLPGDQIFVDGRAGIVVYQEGDLVYGLRWRSDLSGFLQVKPPGSTCEGYRSSIVSPHAGKVSDRRVSRSVCRYLYDIARSGLRFRIEHILLFNRVANLPSPELNALLAVLLNRTDTPFYSTGSAHLVAEHIAGKVSFPPVQYTGYREYTTKLNIGYTAEVCATTEALAQTKAAIIMLINRNIR